MVSRSRTGNVHNFTTLNFLTGSLLESVHIGLSVREVKPPTSILTVIFQVNLGQLVPLSFLPLVLEFDSIRLPNIRE